MELGNKLIKLRKRDKISQEVLAEMLGVSRQTISNWENDLTKPDICQLKKISKIFNISIDEFLDNSVRDIIEKKVSKTEELTNKTTKNIRIMIITLYFIILSLLVGFIVYCFTNKDFTNKYQFEFVCSFKDKDLFIELSSEYIDDDKIGNYIIEIRERKDGHTKARETFNAGDSIATAIGSIKYLKEILISQGAVCK